MAELGLLLGIAALAVAVTSAVVQAKRHKTLRRRVERQRVMAAFDHNMLKAGQARGLGTMLEAEGRVPRLPIELRSQHGEDLFIVAMFPEVREGFYIEAGAFDGYTYAVTYGLEAIGWTGLLVEPLPHRAERARLSRPFSRVEQVAVGPPGGPDRVSLLVDAQFEHKQELFSRVLSPSESSGDGRTVEVSCTTFDALLEGHEGPIHAAVLDMEGFERPALEGFDLDRHRPIMLMIEDHARRDDSELGRYLESRGYAHAGWLSYNRIAVRADEPAKLMRARFLLHESDRGFDQPADPPDNRVLAAGATGRAG